MKMRLFTAIPLPDKTIQRLREMQSGKIRGVRWQTGSMHLTLVFIGNTEENKGIEIKDMLAEVKFKPFDMIVRGVGVFPSVRKPRVLWAGIEHNERLSGLQRDVRRIIENCNVKTEERSYVPHITLAKLNRTEETFLGKYMDDYGDGFIDRVIVDRFGLYESKLNAKGAIHHCLRFYTQENEKGL